MEQRTQKTDLDLIREQKPEEMMSAANCGMQDEKTHEKEAEGILRKRAQNLGRPPGRTSTDRMKKALDFRCLPHRLINCICFQFHKMEANVS